MDEVLYYKSWVAELQEQLEKLTQERDILRYKLEDTISDTKEALWDLRKILDEKVTDAIEVLEDMEYA